MLLAARRLCHEAPIVPSATLQDRTGPKGGHLPRQQQRGLLGRSWVVGGWVLTVALFALLVARAPLRDPDSQLYETLARSLEARPISQWVAPLWPEGRAKSGIFVEHLASSLWPAALLGRLGLARGALVANFLWYLAAALLLHRLAAALALADRGARGSDSGPGSGGGVPASSAAAWAATFAWVLSPFSVQTLLRANHEPALLVAYLGALLCLAGPAHRRAALGLPLSLLLAVAIKGGLGLLVFPAALAGLWALAPGRALAWRRARIWQLLAGLLFTALFCGLYQLWFRQIAHGSFFAGYLWSQGKGTLLAQHEAPLRMLTNPLYYAANALWFALPGTLFLALDLAPRLARGGALRLGTEPAGLQGLAQRRLALGVFAALLVPLSLMARRAVRYLFPAIALWAVPGGEALCRRCPRLARKLDENEACLPFLLMSLVLGLSAVRVWQAGR